MARDKVSQWSSVPASNTDVGGIDIAEGCAPSGINNAIREMMAQIKDMQSGTDGDTFTVGGNLTVNGTSTFIGIPTAPTASSLTNTTQLATTAFVQSALALMFPVGCIYTTTVATNPATLFGFGTWTAFGAGRVLIGNGGGFTAGDTGGSADAVLVSHTHTASVTDPGHTHNYVKTTRQGAAGPLENGGEWDAVQSTVASSSATTGISVSNSTTGVSGTNANLQPYVVVYMWNRTA